MSTDHTGDHCAVKGKMTLSQDQANQYLSRMKGMVKYKCSECGGWHMGHKTKGRWMRNKRARG